MTDATTAPRASGAPQVLIYDTLLRDGSQMEGIAFSLDDKVAIAHRLDALGVNYRPLDD